MTDDLAIYISFTRTDNGGTLCLAVRGYSGPFVARLLWDRALSPKEESEMATAIRAGARLPLAKIAASVPDERPTDRSGP